MKGTFGSSDSWLLTPNAGDWSCALDVYSYGFVLTVYNVDNAYGVSPVLYLNSDVEFKDGDGSSAKPYQLSA